jgi:hypothetical protein
MKKATFAGWLSGVLSGFFKAHSHTQSLPEPEIRVKWLKTKKVKSFLLHKNNAIKLFLLYFCNPE